LASFDTFNVAKELTPRAKSCQHLERSVVRNLAKGRGGVDGARPTALPTRHSAIDAWLGKAKSYRCSDDERAMAVVISGGAEEMHFKTKRIVHLRVT